MEYEVIRENAMDEAVAVLYNTIESGLGKKNYEELESRCVLLYYSCEI